MHSQIRHRQILPFAQGEMVEWSITAVLKTAVLRGTGGSNPSLSAIKGVNQAFARFTPFFTPKNVKLGVLYYINEVRYSYFRDCVLLIKFIQSHNN